MSALTSTMVPPIPYLASDDDAWPLRADDDDDAAVDNTKVYVWYALLLAVSALNVTLLSAAWAKIDATDRYSRAMKALAVPWVLECAW